MAMTTLTNAEVTKIYSDANMFNLGQQVEDAMGNTFEFVKYNEADGLADAVAGYIAVGLDSGFPDGEVTADVDSTGVTAWVQDVRGIFMAALTDEDYGFVQKTGRNRIAMLSDGTVAAGNRLTAHTTTTGAVKPKVAATAADIGVALEADAATVLAVGSVRLTIGV